MRIDAAGRGDYASLGGRPIVNFSDFHDSWVVPHITLQQTTRTVGKYTITLFTCTVPPDTSAEPTPAERHKVTGLHWLSQSDILRGEFPHPPLASTLPLLRQLDPSITQTAALSARWFALDALPITTDIRDLTYLRSILILHIFIVWHKPCCIMTPMYSNDLSTASTLVNSS
eukprot:SAG25_NODE_4545_length_793_cov_1.832853_1_plen_171_part_01